MLWMRLSRHAPRITQFLLQTNSYICMYSTVQYIHTYIQPPYITHLQRSNCYTVHTIIINRINSPLISHLSCPSKVPLDANSDYEDNHIQLPLDGNNSSQNIERLDSPKVRTRYLPRVLFRSPPPSVNTCRKTFDLTLPSRSKFGLRPAIFWYLAIFPS